VKRGEGGEGVLRDEGDGASAEGFGVGAEEGDVAEAERAVEAGGVGEDAEDGAGQRGLAAAGFADETHDLAGFMRRLTRSSTRAVPESVACNATERSATSSSAADRPGARRRRGRRWTSQQAVVLADARAAS
jgi:hypothetical protein